MSAAFSGKNFVEVGFSSKLSVTGMYAAEASIQLPRKKRKKSMTFILLRVAATDHGI